MLVFKSISFFVLLPLLFLGIAVTGDVDLGIQKDFQKDSDEPQDVDIQSYSGWVKWHDQADLQVLTDAEFLNFARLAYERMVDIHRSTLLPIDRRPGAMAVYAVGRDMFFGSSMKNGYQAYYNSQNSVVGQYLSNCEELSDSVHRNRLACAEPNVIDVAMHTGQLDPSYGGGRIAIWATVSQSGPAMCLEPCKDGGSYYGCGTLISKFEISRWVPKRTNPDGTDGTQWASKFDVQKVPKRSCPKPF